MKHTKLLFLLGLAVALTCGGLSQNQQRQPAPTPTGGTAKDVIILKGTPLYLSVDQGLGGPGNASGPAGWIVQNSDHSTNAPGTCNAYGWYYYNNIRPANECHSPLLAQRVSELTAEGFEITWTDGTTFVLTRPKL